MLPSFVLNNIPRNVKISNVYGYKNCNVNCFIVGNVYITPYCFLWCSCSNSSHGYPQKWWVYFRKWSVTSLQFHVWQSGFNCLLRLYQLEEFLFFTLTSFLCAFIDIEMSNILCNCNCSTSFSYWFMLLYFADLCEPTGILLVL